MNFCKKLLVILLIFSIALSLGACTLLEDDLSEDKTGTGGGTAITATIGERNALRSAKNYLNVMAFSYEGLKEQLEFEGYSETEATYAVDNCGANWFEQAKKKAKEYLDAMSFSKSGLITQLEFEKFTHEQAVYGVEANGYN